MNVEHLLLIPPNLLKLEEKQRIFAWNVHHLIEWTYKAGYEITLAEAYRTPEQAALNVKNASGIANSLHTQRLAIDLNLFKDGVYLTDSASHKKFGDWWKTQATPECETCWGGDFKNMQDGNHYSIAHGGFK